MNFSDDESLMIFHFIHHAGNLLICSHAAIHLHVGENRHSGVEGPGRHEGLHTRPDHPGDDQHPQPVWEDHRQHGRQPDAGKHLFQPNLPGAGYVQAYTHRTKCTISKS